MTTAQPPATFGSVRRDLLNFFWPTKLNPVPNTLTRFGRVLHWLAIAVAVLILLGSVPIVWYFLNHPVYEGSYGANASLRHGALALPAAAVIVLLGRGLRHIIGGE